MQGRRRQLVFVRLEPLDIAADDFREIKTADEVSKRFELILNRLVHVGVGPARGADLMVEIGDPALDDGGDAPPSGFARVERLRISSA